MLISKEIFIPRPSLQLPTKTTIKEDRENYHCYTCSEQFTDRLSFTEHWMKHVKDKFRKSAISSSIESMIYKCDVCMNLFKSKQKLRRHILSVCCSHLFAPKRTEPGFHGRLKVQEQKNSLACTLCNYKSQCRSNLTRHLRQVHSDLRPFKCYSCDASFKGSRDLSNHIASLHSDSRPFNCSLCNASFKLKYNLKQHCKSHSEVRLFSCDTCASSFKRKGELSRHKLVHSDSKKFTCSFCDYRCYRKSNVQQHIKAVHENVKPFRCLSCNRCFSVRASLKSHAKKLHKI